MRLGELFPNRNDIAIEGPEDWENVEITDLTQDSRTVSGGSLFFCVDGFHVDGHRYAPAAARAGAACIVHTKELNLREIGPASGGETGRTGLSRPVLIRVKDVLGAMNEIADRFYGHPSGELLMFGVTGTNGKTTVANILESVFSQNRPTGSIGTVAIRYGDVVEEAAMTTPDQIETQKILRRMADYGMKACAMEVSSQGLDRRRVDAVDFDCAIFTNLTHDHLDYHKTMAKYLEAKKRLFRGLRRDACAVLNADDVSSFEELKACCPCRVVTYGTSLGEVRTDELGDPIEGSRYAAGSPDTVDYFADVRELRLDGSRFTLWHGGRSYDVETNLAAGYNVYNLTAAMAAMNEMGMPIEAQLPFVQAIPQVRGRMERIDEGQDFTVIVDYAHTPDGYEKIFGYAREAAAKTGGRIIAMLSNPGGRDHLKRPTLGRIAGAASSRIILTTQDPRDEDPAQIAADIAAGAIPEGALCQFVPDREEAVRTAVNAADPGDVVLLLGKGAETRMLFGTKSVPYISDPTAARRALRERLGK